jgi:hypothetical protein
MTDNSVVRTILVLMALTACFALRAAAASAMNTPAHASVEVVSR